MFLFTLLCLQVLSVANSAAHSSPVSGRAPDTNPLPQRTAFAEERPRRGLDADIVGLFLSTNKDWIKVKNSGNSLLVTTGNEKTLANDSNSPQGRLQSSWESERAITSNLPEDAFISSRDKDSRVVDTFSSVSLTDSEFLAHLQEIHGSQ